MNLQILNTIEKMYRIKFFIQKIIYKILYDVYSFLAAPPARQCYEITSITASSNNNDLPTIYGPKTDCYDSDCVQP